MASKRKFETHPCVRTNYGDVGTSSFPNAHGAAQFPDYVFYDRIVHCSLDVGNNEYLIPQGLKFLCRSNSGVVDIVVSCGVVSLLCDESQGPPLTWQVD